MLAMEHGATLLDSVVPQCDTRFKVCQLRHGRPLPVWPHPLLLVFVVPALCFVPQAPAECLKRRAGYIGDSTGVLEFLLCF